MGWLGQWRSLVLYPMVMSFKEEVKLLVKPRPDIGSVEVHDIPSLLFLDDLALVMPLWASLSSHTLWEGGAPSEVRVWMSYQPQWSTHLNQSFGSWSKIRKVFFIHMFFHPSCSGCGAFISSDEEQGFCHSCSVFKNKKHWRLSLQAYTLLKEHSILGVFNV